MKNRFEDLLKNQGVEFTRETAKVQLERARVTLSLDWSRHREGKASTAAAPGARTRRGARA